MLFADALGPELFAVKLYTHTHTQTTAEHKTHKKRRWKKSHKTPHTPSTWVSVHALMMMVVTIAGVAAADTRVHILKVPSLSPSSSSLSLPQYAPNRVRTSFKSFVFAKGWQRHAHTYTHTKSTQKNLRNIKYV